MLSPAFCMLRARNLSRPRNELHVGLIFYAFFTHFL